MTGSGTRAINSTESDVDERLLHVLQVHRDKIQELTDTVEGLVQANNIMYDHYAMMVAKIEILSARDDATIKNHREIFRIMWNFLNNVENLESRIRKKGAALGLLPPQAPKKTLVMALTAPNGYANEDLPEDD
jgi:hypothetical protein